MEIIAVDEFEAAALRLGSPKSVPVQASEAA
jgi:hypothetical protein